VNVAVAPAAQLELIEAAVWYDDTRPGLGTEFLEAIQQAFLQIASEPRLHATLEYWTDSRREVRRHCLRRFPYVIVYWIEGESVLVVAVSHTRRRPLYWIDRIPE
jgi:toxin ParE1/3/4